MNNLKTLRVFFHKIEGDKFIATNSDKKVIVLYCSNKQIKELIGLTPFIQKGNVFNLVNVKEKTETIFESEFIIFEPDYLIDISSLAECFKPYGHHFLNYLLSRLRQRKITIPMLLGNVTNFFMDELLNENKNQQVNYISVLRKAFKLYSFEFTVCENLNDSKIATIFFTKLKKHFEHIQKIIKNSFPKMGINKKKIILEPSFVCQCLGLQGRLDILLQDYSKLIELKSGKAVENFSTGQFLNSVQCHYIQLILYLAMLEFNVDIPSDKIDFYLLYSLYPILSKEHYYRHNLQTVLSIRNQIVSCEYNLQKNNDVNTCFEILSKITSRTLNIRHTATKFFTSYLAPEIDRFHYNFFQLKKYEKIYFLRLYVFLTKELWISKAGKCDYEGKKTPSVLWNVSFKEKLLAGGLLYDLKIIDIQSTIESYTIVFEIPKYKDLYLPNFRSGDVIILYKRCSEVDTVNNRQIFKGIIEDLEEFRLKIRLRNKQKDSSIWDIESFYAIEHDYMDSTYISMFRGLTSFIYANQDRRDLLIAKHSCLKNKKEIFLLIGPPGTGKTSIALKQIVENEIKNNSHSSVLLLSYTNRAVDEICRTLLSISPFLQFIRVGSELTCDKSFHSYLLERHLSGCKKRSEVAELINSCRIYVGTVTSVWNKSELFYTKQFDLAIIDEAAQLLEPHLLGIFCSKNCNGENAIRRFILIGDYKQLPAVVLQTKKESEVKEIVLNTIGMVNLRDSLFERFYRKYNKLNLTSHYSILFKQGRMHPDIAYFPSHYFYESQLISAELPHQRESQINNRRLHFYDIIPSKNEKAIKININEAMQAVNICKNIYLEYSIRNEFFDSQIIGIITPFRNQIAIIRQQLEKTNIRFFSDILVETVERFQGSQRDIIIYSFCIKTEEQLESLSNCCIEENGKLIDKKLNVVLTRARKQLYIIGNESLLIKNFIYKKLIDCIKNFAR
ncbi:MAG: AAA family ATPase [Bacteroidales bacterium OttesenSCG-928-I14]|jgi:hypothetical protein|nr:AAA family ATPase [Bacteroidales bacterium OttesenSCG-928-I14]